MHIILGGTVAVQGPYGLGHPALQYYRKMVCWAVALSRDASKKDFATQLGATNYVDGSQEDKVFQLRPKSTKEKSVHS
jgi:D-arabinose 1-dehydrogenase-like Zn-dependent alcohol dehydrogenase